MDYSKATNEQLKVILDWEEGVSSHLIRKLYEEVLDRRLMDSKITHWIYRYFGTKRRAEEQTRLTVEDLLWIGYELGHECIDRYKPIKPFTHFWYTVFTYKIRDIARDNKAQMRTAEIQPLDDMVEWSIPDSHDTEKTAINRVIIENIMNQLRDTEKEIVIKRYEGYTYPEIARMQGVSNGGMQKRVTLYKKRLQGVQ